MGEYCYASELCGIGDALEAVGLTVRPYQRARSVQILLSYVLIDCLARLAGLIDCFMCNRISTASGATRGGKGQTAPPACINTQRGFSR